MVRKSEPPDDRTPFKRMADLAGKLISIPKDEVDKREREWKEGRKNVAPAAPPAIPR